MNYRELKDDEPKKFLNYFLGLSLVCLILAGVMVVTDTINGDYIIHTSDYLVVFLGLICLTLGLAVNSKLEIELLKQQSSREVKHE